MSTSTPGAAAAALADTRSRRTRVRLAQQRTTSAALWEAGRVTEALQQAAPALEVILSRARQRAGGSTRVRALGLDCLPDPHRITGANLARARLRPHRPLPAATRTEIEIVGSTLVLARDLTASPQIAVDLGLSVTVIAAAQTGLRAALAAHHRMLDHLDDLRTGRFEVAADAAVEMQPYRPASCIVQAVSRVLPLADRLRYLEEFRAELAELHPGRRRQLRHALRLALGAWALRAALLANAADPASGAGRVRAVAPAARRRPRHRADRHRTPWGGWSARRDSRVVTRLTADRRRAILDGAMERHGRPGRGRHRPAAVAARSVRGS